MHAFIEQLPVGGWTGYIHFLPEGVKPSEPQQQPQRPDASSDDVEEL
jgi:hypothetical protein